MYKYSAKNNAFYLAGNEAVYRDSGTWPDDAKDIETRRAESFMVTPPQGKRRIAGADGMPAWGDIPPPTAEELAQQAEAHRTQFLTYADAVMADWRTELALGEISDADKAKLTAWMAYKREVKAVDASKPVWPPKPAE
ncbi:tail fiber assembly protein [Escherichia coli]|nr:tail fiber assembly protein [Escherichia coli]